MDYLFVVLRTLKVAVTMCYRPQARSKGAKVRWTAVYVHH